MKRSLYWVTKDLRINDNTALNIASKSDLLICVFVVDKKCHRLPPKDLD